MANKPRKAAATRPKSAPAQPKPAAAATAAPEATAASATAEGDEKQFTHLFVNSPIDGKLYRQIMKILKRPETDTIVLSLVTLGGSANDAYRIGRYLQLTWPQLLVFVPTQCASAGTLLVCAGSRLILSPLAELGPLDAQIMKPDELRSRKSGLVLRSIFENLGQHSFELYATMVENIIQHSGGTIKYRTAAHIAGEMVVGLMDGLYEQINPEQVGEDYRFLKVAVEYGKRLAHKGKNIINENVESLVYEFPAHDFIIDFREATALFKNVSLPSAALMADVQGTDTPFQPCTDRNRVVRVTILKGEPTHDVGP